MKRVCVFAHWDRDNIVDDYVIYYLKALREVCETLIFVSDCDLEQNETSKLEEIADFVLAQKHGEYDFGSYKRGFFLACEKKLDFDELIFANDSCYGPFYPLKPIFEKMSKKKCDFWGITRNRYGVQKVYSYNKIIISPHVQSYFIVFKKPVFTSKIFADFFGNVKHEAEKEDIISNYEIGLSKALYENGFNSQVYINKYRFTKNAMGRKWKQLIEKDRCPFLKTTIVKNGFNITGAVKGWDKILEKQTNYPIALIRKHSARLLELYEDTYSKMNIYRKIRFNLLRNMPEYVRSAVIIIEKKLFIVLNAICFNKLKKF